MAFSSEERASIYATYYHLKTSSTYLPAEIFRETAKIHNCSDSTVRLIVKEVENSALDDDISKLTKVSAMKTHLVADLVEKEAMPGESISGVVERTYPELARDAAKIEKAVDSLTKFDMKAHDAASAIMDRVTALALECKNVTELNVLADTVFKARQAFFSQGMQVSIQQNHVDGNALTSLMNGKYKR